MTEKIEPTELDKELLEKADLKKQGFITDMVKYRTIYLEDETNDYPFFLYLASILNFTEYHNGGCLTECGMKSLQLDISPYIHDLQTGEPKLTQKNLVRFLLNLLNSYACSVLVNSLIAFYKEEPVKFLELNDFPKAMISDFDKLEQKTAILMEKLKQVLDTYFTSLESRYKTIFNEEKTKGFFKPIFDVKPVKLNQSGFPTGLENAKEVKSQS